MGYRHEEKSSSLLVWARILAILSFVLWMGIRTVAYVNFERFCEGNLKRAADANTVGMAVQEMKTAINYIEREGLTEGYTSILWRTPDADVGFWYKNLKSSLNELENINPNATQLEKSNVLMKLRETLLDKGDRGVEGVTSPSGISVYPHNTGTAIFGLLSLLALCMVCPRFIYRWLDC